MQVWGRPPDCVLHRLLSAPKAYLQPPLDQVLLPSLACMCAGNARLCTLVEPSVSPAQLLGVLQQPCRLCSPASCFSGQEQLPHRYFLSQRVPPQQVPDMLCFFQQRLALLQAKQTSSQH